MPKGGFVRVGAQNAMPTLPPTQGSEPAFAKVRITELADVARDHLVSC